MIQIIHITDFHISDPAALDRTKPGELLREQFFDEYLSPLCGLLKEQIVENANLVIAITGDFVNVGRVAGFSHSELIIKMIQESVGASNENVFVCIGNHDYDYGSERVGEFSKARSEFVNFRSRVSKRDAKVSIDRGELFDLGFALLLSLDSTLGGECGRPGGFEEEEADILLKDIKSAKDTPLIVLSHYPAEVFPGDLGGAQSEPEYLNRHTWQGAGYFRERLSAVRGSSPTVWISGDIHKPDALLSKSIYHIVTGRLGAPPDSVKSAIERQARLISIIDDKVLVSTFEFNIRTHEDQAQVGAWSCAVSGGGIRRIDTDVESKRTDHGIALVGHDVEVQSNFWDVLSEDLESTVESRVAELELYSLGKFVTSPNFVSLSWISVGPLLNQTGMVDSIVSAMFSWCCTKIDVAEKDVSADQFLFVGIDCWGAVIASQLSVKSGCPNFCVAARNGGRHASNWERVSKRLVPRLERCRYIIFVADVISSGATIRGLRDEIASLWREDHGDTALPPFLCICVFTDPFVEKGIDFTLGNAAVCLSIPMPVLPADRVPSDEFVRSVISFT